MHITHSIWKIPVINYESCRRKSVFIEGILYFLLITVEVSKLLKAN